MTELKNAKLLQQAPQRCLSSTFWLVVRHENPQMKVLMVSCSGEQALPVFSGEAEMFVWLGGSFENYWQVRDISAEAHLKSPKGGFRPDVEGLRACAVKSFI